MISYSITITLTNSSIKVIYNACIMHIHSVCRLLRATGPRMLVVSLGLPHPQPVQTSILGLNSHMNLTYLSVWQDSIDTSFMQILGTQAYVIIHIIV